MRCCSGGCRLAGVGLLLMMLGGWEARLSPLCCWVRMPAALQGQAVDAFLLPSLALFLPAMLQVVLGMGPKTCVGMQQGTDASAASLSPSHSCSAG